MRERRIRQIIAAFGGELRRWPAAARSEARNLLSHDPAAWEELSRARRLDALLDRLPELAPSPGLEAAILARAAAATQDPAEVPARPDAAGAAGRGRGMFAALADLFGPGRVWPQVAGLAAAAIFGFYMGANGLINFSASASPTSTISMDLSDFGGVL